MPNDIWLTGMPCYACYTRRVSAIPMLADLRDALGDCEFALSVLEEVGHIKRSKYQYRITGAGVLAYAGSKDSN